MTEEEIEMTYVTKRFQKIIKMEVSKKKPLPVELPQLVIFFTSAVSPSTL